LFAEIFKQVVVMGDQLDILQAEAMEVASSNPIQMGWPDRPLGF